MCVYDHSLPFLSHETKFGIHFKFLFQSFFWGKNLIFDLSWNFTLDNNSERNSFERKSFQQPSGARGGKIWICFFPHFPLKFYFYAWKCRLFCIFMIIPNPLSTLFSPAFVCLLSVFTILLTLKTDREQFNKKYELVNLWKSYVMIFLRFSLFSNFLSIAFTSSHQKKSLRF